MTTVDDIIDAIDNALMDHSVSEDAMRWIGDEDTRSHLDAERAHRTATIARAGGGWCAPLDLEQTLMPELEQMTMTRGGVRYTTDPDTVRCPNGVAYYSPGIGRLPHVDVPSIVRSAAEQYNTMIGRLGSWQDSD